jgi:hypothetical protein
MWYTFSLIVLGVLIGFPLYGIAFIFDFRLDKEISWAWIPEAYSEEELKARTPNIKPYKFKNEITFVVISLFFSYLILMGNPNLISDIWDFFV